MGEALRETWIWVLLALLIGLAAGYVIAGRTARPPATAAGAPNPNPQLAAEPTAHVLAPVEPPMPVQAPTPLLASTPAAATSAAKTAAKSAAKTAAKTATTVTSARRRSPKAEPTLDLAEAKAVLGTTVKLNDFKVLEGIGPKIEALVKADGLITWRELSRANVERLQGILDAAGPRYGTHNPGSWPAQAGLLADGKWVDFKKLTDKLKGGR